MKLVGIIRFKGDAFKNSRFREQELLTVVTQAVKKAAGVQVQLQHVWCSASTPPAHHVKGRSR